MSFKELVISDMDKVFLNTEEFGEDVTLVRGGTRYTLKALYDELPLSGESFGGGVDAISHNPRLIVSASALPNKTPKKNDVFELQANELHPAKVLIAKDFELPRDGSCIYYLKNKV